MMCMVEIHNCSFRCQSDANIVLKYRFSLALTVDCNDLHGSITLYSYAQSNAN